MLLVYLQIWSYDIDKYEDQLPMNQMFSWGVYTDYNKGCSILPIDAKYVFLVCDFDLQVERVRFQLFHIIEKLNTGNLLDSAELHQGTFI